MVEHDFSDEIEQAWQQILYKPAPKETLSTDLSNHLPIVDVMASAGHSVISVDMVKQWRAELLDIIDTLRESMVEF